MVLDLATASARRQERSALSYLRLTRYQREVARHPAPVLLWRDGNQLGKSTYIAWDCVHRCRGTHPWQRTHRVPIRVLVISTSLEQMLPLMEKLWKLLPKDEIDTRLYWDDANGISGTKNRVISFVRGPGAGSSITLATYKQGASRVAGGTYHVVYCDEPPTEAMYGEVVPRVLRLRGHIRLTFTPVPDMPDQSWLREKVERGEIPELNWGLAEEGTWPEGAPRPLLTQAEIDAYEASLLSVEREMRMRGAWEPVVTGRWLEAFDESCVRSFELHELAGAHLVVGMDHGTTGGKQTAMLVAVKDRDTRRPRAWFIDESVSSGFTTPEHDAAAILAMLDRNGLHYDDVDDWIGDVPTKSRRRDVRKSNSDLRRELAWQLDRPVEMTKPIAEPKKFSGSLTYGMRRLNNLFARRVAWGPERGAPHGIVHPRCVQFRAACERFQGDTKDPLKDVLDGGRYAVELAITGPIEPVVDRRW